MKKNDPITIIGILLASWLFFGAPIGIPAIQVAGPRIAYIVRESDEDSPAFARLVANLREGPVAKLLDEGKHRVDALDDDNPAAAKWVEQLKGVQQPAIVVVAPPDKVLAKQSLPADATANTVLEIIKKNGG